MVTTHCRRFNRHSHHHLVHLCTALLCLLAFAGKMREIECKRMTLYAAGFFPVSRKIPEGAIGRGVIPAVELALQHINDSPKVLRGIHLDLVWNDTEVS